MNVALDALALKEHNTGIGTSIENLLAGLASANGDHRFTIYVPPYQGAESLTLPAGARVVAVGSARSRTGRALWRQMFLNRRLLRDGADLLHGTAYLLPRRPAVPSVVTVHDVLALTNPEFCPTLNRWHFRRLLGPSVGAARMVIAGSRHTADELVRRLEVPAGKIEVINPGIAERFYAPVTEQARREVSRRYQLPERYVLFVGNMDPKKNISRLLTAMETVWNKGLKVKLIMTAPWGWKNRRELSRVVALESRGMVGRTGYVPARDMPGLYAGAELVALVSLAEGFGMPVVEAMAVGTPVLVSDAPGLADAGGGAALMAGREDVAAMAEAMVRIMSEKDLRRELTVRGREHAEKFRVLQCGQKHLALYRQAVQ